MRLSNVLLALGLMLAVPTTMAQDQYVYVTFAKGRAEIALPVDVETEELADGSLLGRLGGTRDHTVEVTVHELGDGKLPDNAGQRFVEEQAEKKGLKFRKGKDRASFMEPPVDFEKEGVTFRRVHMQVGTGRLVAVMTITAPMPMTPVLQAFVGQPINVLVNSVRSSATQESSTESAP